MALAVGMAAGMGMGDNSKASLITRGLAETARLGSALGADPATFMGLAGVGDLIATCMSHLSRNRTFGEMLGQAAGNLVALSRIGNDVMDLAVRNARVAGRADVVSLHRQLARNEDKLEAVLETVERLEEDLAEERRRHRGTAADQGE